MRDQPFASPEEALEHYGVKGMRWGVRKEEDTGSGQRPAAKPSTPASSVARVNEATKQKLTPTLTTKRSNPASARSSNKTQHGGLTPAQKKALLAAGFVTVAGVSFLAYKHYAGGTLPRGFDPSVLAKGPISKGPLDHGHPSFMLRHPEKLMIDTSKGYADMTPINGFPNKYVAARHAELISSLDEMRKKYPAVRNMNIEVVPMSQLESMADMARQKSPAAVQSIRAGEARIYYNDTMDALNVLEASYVRKWQPGAFTPGFIGNHEMGHLLAAAHGTIPPSFDLMTAKPPHLLENIKYSKDMLNGHRKLMAKHGFTFQEVSKLSRYAGTSPSEALAELHAYTTTPGYRERMPKDVLTAAEALFNELGGVTS